MPPILTVSVRDTADFWDNAAGGRKPGTAVLNKLQLGGSFAGDKLGLTGWPIHLQIFRTDDNSPSKKDGDIQPVDSIDAHPVTRLFEREWYDHQDLSAPILRRCPGVGDGRGCTAAPRAGKPEEVILVVEDEERLRNFTTEALRDLGYTVVHAEDGAEALIYRMIESGQGRTLLFTDIVMPGMTGRQLADIAVTQIPGLKVLYTTGYTQKAVVHNATWTSAPIFSQSP